MAREVSLHLLERYKYENRCLYCKKQSFQDKVMCEKCLEFEYCSVHCLELDRAAHQQQCDIIGLKKGRRIKVSVTYLRTIKGKAKLLDSEKNIRNQDEANKELDAIRNVKSIGNKMNQPMSDTKANKQRKHKRKKNKNKRKRELKFTKDKTNNRNTLLIVLNNIGQGTFGGPAKCGKRELSGVKFGQSWWKEGRNVRKSATLTPSGANLDSWNASRITKLKFKDFYPEFNEEDNDLNTDTQGSQATNLTTLNMIMEKDKHYLQNIKPNKGRLTHKYYANFERVLSETDSGASVGLCQNHLVDADNPALKNGTQQKPLKQCDVEASNDKQDQQVNQNDTSDKHQVKQSDCEAFYGKQQCNSEVSNDTQHQQLKQCNSETSNDTQHQQLKQCNSEASNDTQHQQLKQCNSEASNDTQHQQLKHGNSEASNDTQQQQLKQCVSEASDIESHLQQPASTASPALHKCSHCSKESFTLKLCTRCGKNRYCDQTCQKKDYSAHKEHCRRERKFRDALKRFSIVVAESLLPNPHILDEEIDELIGNFKNSVILEITATESIFSCFIVEFTDSTGRLGMTTFNMTTNTLYRGLRDRDDTFSDVPLKNCLKPGNFMIVKNAQWTTNFLGVPCVLTNVADKIYFVLK